MRLPIRGKIAELQAAIGGTLSEMGLRIKVRLIDGQDVIRFENDTGSAYSPVDIVLPYLRSAEPTWNGCEVGIRMIEKQEISDNGWLHFSTTGFREAELGEDDACNYELINRLLRSQGVVLEAGENSNVTANDDLAGLARELRGRLHEIGDFAVCCERENGVETINSIDANGCEWQIAFHDTSATGCAVSIDGEPIAKFDPSETSRLVGYVLRSFWSRGPKI
jgi:hypothetical protein